MATYELYQTGATEELINKIKSADDDTLQAAKDYANSVVETGTADGATVTYVNQQDAATLTSAKSYADEAVSKANHLKYEAVDALPTAGEENVVYGVIDSSKTGDNKRIEYIWVNGEWEVWGTDEVDLSDYLKKTDTAASAEKLTTSAGSATQPVYFSSGVPVACNTTVGNTTVPIYSNAGVLTALSSLSLNTTGSAASLTTARTIRTNLASTSTASFDGSANITPGVTGTLAISNGGTGATNADTALSNLGGISIGDCAVLEAEDIDNLFEED